MTEDAVKNPDTTGLILSGGGARGAYQVGVLSAIADLLPDSSSNPFPVIVGTSAGAINAVSLACGALHFREAVRRLSSVWRSFHTDQVYRSDWPGVLRQASRFLGHSVFGIGKQVPVALLDSSPLAGLLERELDFSGIAAALRQRQLRAIAVTAFGYESAEAVTFYQGHAAIDPWLRHRRVGVPTRLGIPHLLASTAIPLVFEPVKINREYFGESEAAPTPRPTGASPSLAQISGHMLNSTFIDNVESDIELLERLNLLGQLVPAEKRKRAYGLTPVEVLVISPSQPLDRIAARHRKELPAAMRLFLRGPGGTREGGGGLLSYLLFEPGYCSDLIELGYQDAMAKQAELRAFLRLEKPEQRSQQLSPSAHSASAVSGDR